MTDDPLDPNAPLETFTIGPWRVTVRQRVTGGLYWIAECGTRDTKGRVTDGMVLSADLPVGFTVADVRADAAKALGGRR